LNGCQTYSFGSEWSFERIIDLTLRLYMVGTHNDTMWMKINKKNDLNQDRISAKQHQWLATIVKVDRNGRTYNKVEMILSSIDQQCGLPWVGSKNPCT